MAHPTDLRRARLLALPLLAALTTGCGGGGTDAAGPSNEQRAAAARQTASGHALCAPGLLGDFYWEIGDAGGVRVSGSQGGGSVTATTALNIASASKWPFAAYVLQRHGDSPARVPYLHFTSGYSRFSNLACASTMTVAECMNGGLDADEAAAGTFHYQGGHMQQLAVTLGLGDLHNAALAAEIRAGLGGGFDFDYVSPQPPGGMRTSARAYGGFLRRLLADHADPLRLGAQLGTQAVCTQAAAGCNAADGESFIPEAFHYALGHWVEDDPATMPADNFAYSSAGAFGFYPWVDRDRRLYGLLAREDTNLAVRQGYASLQCGRLIRQAWKTGVAP